MEFIAYLVNSISTLYLVILTSIFVFILTRGADMVVEGGVELARTLNLSPLIIGATIISIGTTLPETFVSVMAAWSNNPGLSLGNGVGSIIVDTGFILGSMCLFFKVPIDRFVLDRTGWIQIFSASLLVFISILMKYVFHTPRLDRWVGVLFLILLILYLYLSYQWSKNVIFPHEQKKHNASFLKESLQLLFGIIMVIVSSKLLIVSAQELARRMNVPEDVIAATMVAFGTSLPEFITAITAAKKGYLEIMVGNIVGADVLNCFFVIGASALATPLDIPRNFYFLHYPIMLIILYSFRIFISINKDKKFFPHWQGAWLLVIYLGYLFVQYKK